LKISRWLAAAAVAVAPLAFAATADAKPPPIGAQVLGTVHIDSNDPSVAYVTARYLCQDGPEDQWLWVSAKQSSTGQRDDSLRQEGSSQNAAAWVQSHPLGQFTCDGTVHVDTFQINTQFDPVNGGGFGTLRTGKVWVQFCLMDGAGNFLSNSAWVQAVGSNGGNPV